MQITVPIYQRRQHGSLSWVTLGLGPYTARVFGRDEIKLQDQLTRDLKAVIRKLGPSQLPQLELARGTELERATLEFALRDPEGGKLRVHGLFPLIIEPRWSTAEDRVLVVYHPDRQDEWFPYEPGGASGTLGEQASRYFRHTWQGLDAASVEQLKTDERDLLRAVAFDARPRTLLDEVRARANAEASRERATIGGRKGRSGMMVLPTLGVDQTPRAVGASQPPGMPREPYRQQLVRLLGGQRQSSVVVVGPHGVGKTTLIMQLVHDLIEADDWASHHNLDRVRHVWSISGRRLIAGMSFVGQWEQRCVDLIEDVRGKRIILHVEDLHAWGRIGRSRESERALADLFRGPIARGEVTVIAECTAEQLQQLDEDAPSLVAALSRVPVAPTTAAETMRMMLHEARAIERRQDTCFGPLAYRAILELGSPLFPSTALPGKALELLRALGRAHALGEVSQRATSDAPDMAWAQLVPGSPVAGEPLGTRHVVELLSARTGIPALLLERERPLRRQEVIDDLSRHVIGQPEAVGAVADLILRVKTGLCDARRPHGVFLFTGPTGTGKTELARTLAAYLYGHEDRMIRVDMSEYATPGSAARLVGDRWQPDGVLTRAIRQQPFAVVLFDEVEKAHRVVLNLLLQVFDEGRLTDAAGEVADFSHAVLIMTSNLGAKPGASIGFGEDEAARQHETLQAVKAFFAPELFNRIDQVVSFRAITPEAARVIAGKELRRLLTRRGLTDRDIFAQASETVLDVIRDEGFDARDGARSLKRYLDRHITAPLSADITARARSEMRLVRLYWHEGFRLYHESLDEAPAQVDADQIAHMLTWSARDLELRLPAIVQHARTLRASSHLERLTHTARLALQTYNQGRAEAADEVVHLDDLRQRLRELADDLQEYLTRLYPGHAPAIEAAALTHTLHTIDLSAPAPTAHLALSRHANHEAPRRRTAESLLAALSELYFLRMAMTRADDLTRHAALITLTAMSHPAAERRFEARHAWLLEHMVMALARGRGELESWAVRGPNGIDHLRAGEGDRPFDLVLQLEDALAAGPPEQVTLKLVGLCVRDVFEGEHGTHIRHSLGAAPEIVRVSVRQVDAQTSAHDALRRDEVAREAFTAALESAQALPENPDALLPIVRRLRYDPSPHDPFTVELEDFPMCLVTRRTVPDGARGMDALFHTLWTLRLSALVRLEDDPDAEVIS